MKLKTKNIMCSLLGCVVYAIAPASPAQALRGANNFSPIWSFDGKKIAFTSDRDGDPEIYIMNADGSIPARLTYTPGSDAHPYFSRDGKKILFQSTRENGLDTNIYVMDLNGSDVRKLTSLTGFAGNAIYSPDESLIAFQWRPSNNLTNNEKWRICIMNADGGDFHEITSGAANDHVSGWASDGKNLLFYSDRTGNNQIYTMNRDGSNVRRQLATGAADRAASKSPVDMRIVFISERGGNNSKVYITDANGKNVRRLTKTKAMESGPVWSPDGKKIAYSSDVDGFSQVYVVETDGNNLVCLTAPRNTTLPLQVSGIALSSTEASKDGRYYETAARRAYQAKNYPEFLENMKIAVQLRPNHPRAIYNLSIAYILNGQRANALDSLDKIARMGLVVPAGDDADFDSLKTDGEFTSIVKRIESNKLPLGRSFPAFTVHEKGLIPESIAFDPVSKAFYMSSVYKRKIVRVAENGEMIDFANEPDGLWSVFGMKVDAKRRILWACTAAHPQMMHYDPNENGKSAVVKFDLRTGKLLKKYALPSSPGRHLLGDLVVNSHGDVFASDSLSQTIFVLRKGHDTIESFVESKAFGSPQGLAFSSDEKNLFMADYSNGLFAINLATKKITNCLPPPDVAMLGIDGLYMYNGSLIAVQNGTNPIRVVKLSISPDLSRVDGLDVIEANNPAFDEPTLGVVVKDSFYFIANSQWGAVNDKGELAPEGKLKDPLVLKLKLRD